ncbi:serine/threonine-protein phosphatase 2A 56 kDa regulatory subunit epsilon isoform-like [Gopherus evgoodei]|uniref:serine/threonine-protein phosphatase 2A 56 kDa regulatory subunit epsilon isoform-like n=1 Tax=Gopherus evgoodei TaxID=1825980 RepID=UPI0011CF8F8D|nr:serine/threonine-protein phosphatase 2A 56 kDa regulatory subunit epsilon isoform-like [Gopherus evgoodei]
MDMSAAPTTPPSVDKVDGFSRKSVRKARQKRSQSSSQFRSQGKPIELTPLPLLKGAQSTCVGIFLENWRGEMLSKYFSANLNSKEK